jgi:hypothetical protein
VRCSVCKKARTQWACQICGESPLPLCLSDCLQEHDGSAAHGRRAASSRDVSCTVCKKVRPCPWLCLICAEFEDVVAACSGICRRKHDRDGRHRSYLKTVASPGS